MPTFGSCDPSFPPSFIHPASLLGDWRVSVGRRVAGVWAGRHTGRRAGRPAGRRPCGRGPLPKDPHFLAFGRAAGRPAQRAGRPAGGAGGQQAGRRPCERAGGGRAGGLACRRAGGPSGPVGRRAGGLASGPTAGRPAGAVVQGWWGPIVPALAAAILPQCASASCPPPPRLARRRPLARKPLLGAPEIMGASSSTGVTSPFGPYGGLIAVEERPGEAPERLERLGAGEAAGLEYEQFTKASFLYHAHTNKTQVRHHI